MKIISFYTNKNYKITFIFNKILFKINKQNKN